MGRKNWKDALGLLAEMGWESDEIEGACEALIDICDETGEEPADLTARQIEGAIGDELTPEERSAFSLLASVLGADDDDSQDLVEQIRELE